MHPKSFRGFSETRNSTKTFDSKFLVGFQQIMLQCTKVLFPSKNACVCFCFGWWAFCDKIMEHSHHRSTKLHTIYKTKQKKHSIPSILVALLHHLNQQFSSWTLLHASMIPSNEWKGRIERKKRQQKGVNRWRNIIGRMKLSSSFIDTMCEDYDEKIMLTSYASQPLNRVARATRFTPNVKAPIRRSHSWLLHISLMFMKAFLMYVWSTMLTFSSSHMKPWMFCKMGWNTSLWQKELL